MGKVGCKDKAWQPLCCISTNPGQLGRQNEGKCSEMVGEAPAALGSVTAALLVLLPC